MCYPCIDPITISLPRSSLRFPQALVALLAALVASNGGARLAHAEVIRVEVARRVDINGGRAFGSAGPYELIEGRILFAVDPVNRYNARIVDRGRAPRNAAGRVEAWADFAALRPKNGPKDGLALFEVSNRGLKNLAYLLDFGTMAAHPTAAEDCGDGLLLRLGLTIVWVGWQFDVPEDDPDRLGLEAPVATGSGGSPITGLVRADWVIGRPVRSLSLAHGSHVADPVLDPAAAESVLTVRTGRYSQRQVVPRAEWRFTGEVNGAPVDDPRSIYRDQGFEPGKIYEVVYRSSNPKVAGLGLAVIRDAMSSATYDAKSPFPAKQAIGLGISQTGRLLRHFPYQGFNTDERGRKVFDGMLIHVAGAGRGSFNHRFAQPSRDHPYHRGWCPRHRHPA